MADGAALKAASSSLARLVTTTLPHDGSRFSGTRHEYDLTGFEWAVDLLDAEAASYGLGERRQGATWITVLNGRGACVEKHNEGVADTDMTIVMFLSTLGPDDGGRLVLHDPLEKHDPVYGEAVVFPSRRFHEVTALETDEPRVSIAALFQTVTSAVVSPSR